MSKEFAKNFLIVFGTLVLGSSLIFLFVWLCLTLFGSYGGAAAIFIIFFAIIAFMIAKIAEAG